MTTHLTRCMPYRPPDGPEDYRDKEWLRSRYWDDEMSMSEIAEVCDCTKETIRRWIHRHDIDVRDRSEAVRLQWDGADERREKIGQIFAEHHRTIHPFLFIDNEGYNVAGSADGNGGSEFVRMNRLLATLLVDDITDLRGMHVHHKNGVPWLDIEENLEVLTPAEHAKLTRKEVGTINQYMDEVAR